MSVRARLSPAKHSDGPASGAGLDTRTKWLLAVCCIAQFMVILDLTIVNVALPSIQSSLDFSAINLQWVVDAYAIVFAGFLMLAGRTTDHFGHRRSLAGALIAFGLASLLGGCAPDQLVLIIARALQGLSGAWMAASSLATITSSFEPGPARHRAIGLWGAMNGAGGAAGTLLGGIITEELGWRWVLLINPPIGLAAGLVAYAVVTDRRGDRARTRFDLGGALALTGGLVAVVYGIVNAGVVGWGSGYAVVPIIIGVALLGAFPIIEAHFASAPLVPPRAVRGTLRTANLIVVLFSAALFPMWYVGSLYLQQVLGLSPLATGFCFLPMALVIMIVASRAGGLVARVGVRPVLGSGLLMMLAGMALLGRIGPSGSALGFIVLPGMLVALGIGLSVVPSTIAATQSATSEQSGLASGLVNTSRQVGGAIGIALLISVATQYTSHLLGQNRTVSSALTDGFRIAYFIAAGFTALAFLVTVFGLPRPAATAATAGAAMRRRVPVVAAVVIVCFCAVDFGFAGAPGPPIGTYSLSGAATYVSAPGLHPPIVRSVPVHTGATPSSDDLMVASFYDLTTGPMIGQSGPLILDSSLQPIWFRPVPTKVVASSLSEQTYEGKPVLAWWQGVVTSTGATVSGEDIVVNNHYQTVATLRATNGWVITLHDLVITGHDAWVTVNKNIPMDLTAFGGARNGALTDSAVQEYDLRTGALVHSWDALKHIPLSDSNTPPPTNGFPWDAYHVNSISLAGNGTLLVSMRDIWAAYDFTIATGRVDWTLGGPHSSYTFGPGAEFQWQHNVVLHGDEVTLFDDHCCEITGAGTYLAPTGPSRAVVLRLDRATHVATLVRQFEKGAHFDAAYMGSTEILPNGDTVVGWGEQPYFSEYDASGRLALEGEFPAPDLSYRATALSGWVGDPLTPPAAAVRRTGTTTTVYASWNGATRVATWRVLGGASTSQLSVLRSAPRSGFETAIAIHNSHSVLRVEALDSSGHVIGTSRTLRSAAA